MYFVHQTYRDILRYTIGILALFIVSGNVVYAQGQCVAGTLDVALTNGAIPGGCGTPKTVSFDPASTSGTAEATSYYLWYVDGVFIDSVLGTASSRNFTFNSVGSHTVRVVGRTAGGGCVDTATRTINIASTSISAGILDPPRIATATLNPVWNFCNTNPNSPSTFGINVMTQGTDTLKNYTIIWGDGTANNTGLVSNPGNAISHSYTTSGVYTVKIITTNGGCTDTITGTVRNLRPASTSILPLPAGQLAGCAPHTITFQDSTQNAFPGTVITWNFGVGQSTVTRTEAQANTPISYTYPKAASQQCIFTVSITATNTNCANPGPPSTYSVSPILIYDVDIADVAVATPLCDTTRSVTFLNQSQLNCEPGQRLWYWDFGDGTNTGWITSQASQTHVYPTFGNYTVMLIDSNFCGTDTDYLVIRVNRIPKTGFIANPKAGCAPLSVTYADTSGGLAITTRTWTFGTGSGIANRSDSTATVIYNNPGNFRIRLTATNECGTASASDSIHVYAKPTVKIRSGPNGCAPFTRTFLDSTINQSPTAKYKWTFGNGDTSSQRNPPAVTYLTPATYTVKLVVTDTCGADSFTTSVIVSTVPTADFALDTVCRGDSTSFTNTSVLAGGDLLSSIKWYFGDGDSSTLTNPKHVYPTDGIKQVVLRIQTNKGCVDFDTASTRVDVSPVVSITSVNRVCDGVSMSLNGGATTSAGTITGYRWTFGAGTSDTAYVEDTSYVFPSPGSYTLRLRVSNSTGCAFTQTKNITVDPIPDARPTASNLCFGQRVLFRDSSTVNNGNTITQWAWDFNDDTVTDSTTKNPSFQFGSASIFKVKLRVGSNNNCFNTDSIDVTIRPLPDANFSLNGTSKCKLDTFVLSNTSTGAATYRWRFGDGTSDSLTSSTADINKIYLDSGTYTIRLIATTSFGCLDTTTQNINSRPFPVARFTVNDTISCAPKNFVFTNTSILSNNYVWRVNGVNGSITTNRPDTLITTSGQSFTVSLIATNTFGCRPDTTAHLIQTISNPVPIFVSSVDSGCGPLHVNFNNLSTGATSYQWYLGNGTQTTSTDTQATYVPSALNDSIYSVKLIAFNGPGCKDSVSKNIRVFPQPVSNFNASGLTGCGPLGISFTNTSIHKFGGTINDMTFVWDFDNGNTNTSKDVSETFVASAIQDTLYDVQLISTSRFGCSDTSQKTVRVYPNPRSSFTTNQTDGCGALPVTFTNTSVPNDTGTISIMNFNWNFGNGNTTPTVSPSQSFIANLTKDTVYTVRLIAFSEHGCRDTSYENIRVYPKPLADFTMPQDSGCTPFMAYFTNTSLPYDTGDISMMSFVWNLGNGFGNITQDAFGQYNSKPLADSTYHVQLIAISEHGCRDTVIKQVTSHPLPIAAFNNNISQGCGPLNVQFTQSAQLAAVYNWDFGDGDTSHQVNPLHVFQSHPLVDSIYTTRFSVLSAYGCPSDTVFTNIIARYLPVADFSLSNDSICSSGPISFTNQSVGGVNNNWNFGNGSTSTAINPVSTYLGLPTRDTTYTIRLVVTTPYTCRDTAYKTVKVNPLPDVSFTAINPGCTPLPVSFTNTSLRAVSHEWDFADGTTDTATSPSKLFVNNTQLSTQQFMVTLRSYSSSGCSDTAKYPVFVYPQPTAFFAPSVSEGCGPLPITFTNQSAADFSGSLGMRFEWDFGNGQTDTARQPSVVMLSHPDKDTLYVLQMIAYSKFGCSDTMTGSVRVFPKPAAVFTVSDSVDCGPLTVQFTNTSTPKDTGNIGMMSFVWDFANGFNSVLQQPQSSFNNLSLTDTVYHVRLIASSEHGCRDTVRHSITIKPKPTASFTTNRNDGCGPFDVIFTNTSQINSQNHWLFGDGDTASSTSPTHTYQSYPLNDSIYTVSLVTQTAFGCVSDTARRVITARYLPIADFAVSNDSICASESVTFTNLSNGGITNNWNFGNGQTSTTINPFTSYVGLPTRDTTYTIRLIVTTPNACKDTAYKSVKVNPLPDVSFTAINPGCTPLPVTFNNTSLRGVRQQWDFGDGNTDTATNPANVFVNGSQLTNQQFMVTLRTFTASGCSDTAKYPVLVYPQPTAFFAPSVVEGCGPLPITFTNQSASDFAGSLGMKFKWDFGNGQTDTARQPSVVMLSHPDKDTLYTLSMIAYSKFGCSDTMTGSVRVFPKPAAVFTVSDSVDCGPLTVQFTNTSTPKDTGNIGMMSFVWDFTNGFNSVLQQPQSIFSNLSLTDTVYHVRLIASSEHGCRDTVRHSITIKPKPTASFTTNRTEGCGPFDVTFNNTSQINSVSHWQFGDGTTSLATSPTHTYQSYPLNDSVYTASLFTESSFGCVSDTAHKVITARYLPIAGLISSDDSTCNPGSILFFNTSQGASALAWNFGNGQTSISINPVVNYTGPASRDTVYRTRLVASSPMGCKDTTYTNITVNPTPVAGFANVTAACTPYGVTFNNTSQLATRYEWDFGDGTTDVNQNPSKLFENDVALANRNYTITLSAYSTAGCMDTAKRVVTVYPLPLANFTTTKSLNCDTAEFFTNNGSVGATTYSWRIGSVVQSGQPTPMLYFRTSLTGDTTHQVKLVATTNHGCKDSITKPVLVHPIVKAAFTSNGTSSCSNLMVSFANHSNNANSHFWVFGDGTGSSQTNPQHSYTQTGKYDVKLISYDAYGCSDTAYGPNSVEVFEVPTANFLYSPPDAALPNSTINFRNLSFISNGTLSYVWNFGDPASVDNGSVAFEPSHAYSDSGNFAVKLITTSSHGCSDTATYIIRIRPHPPVPDFTFDPPVGCSPLTVQFTNTSQYADSYEWTFDDGQKSTLKNPVITFKYPGKYGAFLRATGPGGIQQLRRDEIIEVYALPRANFFATPLRLILPNSTISLIDISTDAVKWKWKIDLDGTTYFTDVVQNPTYTFPVEGKYSVTLIAITDKGCMDTLTRPELVDVIKGGKSYIGNAFTPNGDGTNDAFKPYLQGALSNDYLFEIYNRWGQRVFSTNDINEAWDGNFNGAPATVDTYVWVVRGKYVGNIDFSEKGTVTLLR